MLYITILLLTAFLSHDILCAHERTNVPLKLQERKLRTMIKDFQGTFGDFLLIKRKDREMTSKDIADKLKISTAYYSYFESGNRKAPERDVQDQIADILELTREERLQLYDLAGKTRGIVAADLPDYINDNPYVRVALRRARDSNTGQEQWLRFIADIDNWQAQSK